MNASTALGLTVCPPPFLLESDYPYRAGQQDGRFCAPSLIDPMSTCCLPCPLTSWVYPDNFDLISHVAGYVGVGSMACCVFLLLSFAILPSQRTSRHYLTICLVAAIFFLELAFIVPLGTKPNQCYDAITPNDLHSDISCALTGIFLLGGGFGGVMWVFIRSLSVHLQIYWKIVPGTTFFYVSQLCGWGLTALILGLSLTMSGVSYRLGTTCHINHVNSIGTFWGPLLAFAAFSLLIQLITFAYCVKVYLQVANGPGGLPSTMGSTTTYNTSVSGSNRSAVVKRKTYQRVRKVVALQWRGMTVVFIVIVSACYLAIVFLMLDRDVSDVSQNLQLILPWVECIAHTHGDNQACANLTSPFILPARIVLPVLYLIAIIGFWALCFLGKWDMMLAWRDLLFGCCRKPRKSSRSSSPTSLRARSPDGFSTRLRSTPQHLHLVKDERGLSVASKGGNTYAMELIRSPSFGRDAKTPSTDPHRSVDYLSYSNKDLESAYSNQHSHDQSQSWVTTTGTGSGSGSGNGNGNHQQPILPVPLDKVWAPPAPRGSFNFSRPATAQPAVHFTEPPRTAHLAGTPHHWLARHHTTSGAVGGYRLEQSSPQQAAPVHYRQHSDDQHYRHRDYDYDGAGDAYMASRRASQEHDRHDEEEDTVPLSPTLPPLIPARAAMRPRAHTDSRASSLYSFSIVGAYGGNGNGNGNSRSQSRTQSRSHSRAQSPERPNHNMMWDPASSFASPSATPVPGQRRPGPNVSRSDSPAFGRGYR